MFTNTVSFASKSTTCSLVGLQLPDKKTLDSLNAILIHKKAWDASSLESCCSSASAQFCSMFCSSASRSSEQLRWVKFIPQWWRNDDDVDGESVRQQSKDTHRDHHNGANYESSWIEYIFAETEENLLCRYRQFVLTAPSNWTSFCFCAFVNVACFQEAKLNVSLKWPSTFILKFVFPYDFVIRNACPNFSQFFDKKKSLYELMT